MVRLIGVNGERGGGRLFWWEGYGRGVCARTGIAAETHAKTCQRDVLRLAFVTHHCTGCVLCRQVLSLDCGIRKGTHAHGPGRDEPYHMVAESRNVSRGKARSRSPTPSQKTPARSKSPLPIKRANGEGKSKSCKEPATAGTGSATAPGFVLVLVALVLAAGAMIAFQKGMVSTNISALLTSGAAGNVEFMGFSGRKVYYVTYFTYLIALLARSLWAFPAERCIRFLLYYYFTYFTYLIALLLTLLGAEGGCVLLLSHYDPRERAWRQDLLHCRCPRHEKLARSGAWGSPRCPCSHDGRLCIYIYIL
jgi:hypothetical protein